MPIFSANQETKRTLRADVKLILHLIASSKKLENYPLTDKGKAIIKMLWEENMSFDEVAEKLSLSKERVVQIYHLEMRKLMYFFDTTIKEVKILQEENESLKKEIKELNRK